MDPHTDQDIRDLLDRSNGLIPNNYIVIFKYQTPQDKCEAHCTWAHELHCQRVSTSAYGASLTGVNHRYNLPNGWSGYSGSFDETLKKEIEETDEVDYISPDSLIYTSAVISENDSESWGLARLSHTTLLTTNKSKHTYGYDDSAGEGTRAYIIDTGIFAEHDDFEGRAKFAHNAVSGSTDADLNGHGTHVSATIGGKRYGIAKKISLYGVKVLGDNGTGNVSGVIAGLNWAVQHADKDGVLNKSVVNMSLGGPFSRALNAAVEAVVSHGMIVCAAAGNESRDAATSSPASEITAITVGSITLSDSMSVFSNWGSAVDIFAPGTLITSAWPDLTNSGKTNGEKTISGTSMASPHVTGLVAYLIALESLSGVAQVKARLNELAGKDMISGLKGGSPNRLAYNGVGNVDKAGVYICNAPGESFETAVPEEPVETGKDDVPDDDVATGPVFSVSAD